MAGFYATPIIALFLATLVLEEGKKEGKHSGKVVNGETERFFSEREDSTL